jgi:hypothetical protein
MRSVMIVATTSNALIAELRDDHGRNLHAPDHPGSTFAAPGCCALGISSVGIYPYGLGRPAMWSTGWSPVGGGNVGHWKWQDPLFPRGFWKSFPTDLLEMEEA